MAFSVPIQRAVHLIVMKRRHGRAYETWIIKPHNAFQHFLYFISVLLGESFSFLFNIERKRTYRRRYILCLGSNIDPYAVTGNGMMLSYDVMSPICVFTRVYYIYTSLLLCVSCVVPLLCYYMFSLLVFVNYKCYY